MVTTTFLRSLLLFIPVLHNIDNLIRLWVRGGAQYLDCLVKVVPVRAKNYCKTSMFANLNSNK